jgi:ATPase subunit of ABC transporter with duplicated ATPase domains
VEDVGADVVQEVCTDILHLNKFKVKRYPGNLDAFVKFVPEARAYYEPMIDVQVLSEQR